MSDTNRYTIKEDTCGGFIVRDEFAEQQMYLDGREAREELYNALVNIIAEDY